MKNFEKIPKDSWKFIRRLMKKDIDNSINSASEALKELKNLMINHGIS